jgi:LmbE family N-acetylglucosaminyl deacetylase
MKKPKICYFSPHSDDMAFCNGGISKILSEYFDVAMVVVFDQSQYSPNIQYVSKDVITSIRRFEDLEFAKEIGAKCIHLGLPDSSLRGYDDDTEVCSIVEDDSVLRWVQRKIEYVLVKLRPELVFIPSANSRHIDHLIVNNVVLRYEREFNIYLYEEIPYASFNNVYQNKLNYDMGLNVMVFLKTIQGFDEKKKLMNIYQSQVTRVDLECARERFFLDSFEVVWTDMPGRYVLINSMRASKKILAPV